MCLCPLMLTSSRSSGWFGARFLEHLRLKHRNVSRVSCITSTITISSFIAMTIAITITITVTISIAMTIALTITITVTIAITITITKAYRSLGTVFVHRPV